MGEKRGSDERIAGTTEQPHRHRIHVSDTTVRVKYNRRDGYEVDKFVVERTGRSLVVHLETGDWVRGKKDRTGARVQTIMN